MKKFLLIAFISLLTITLFAKPKGYYTEDDIGSFVLDTGALLPYEEYEKSKNKFNVIAIVWSVAEDGTYFKAIGIESTEVIWSEKEYYNCDSGLENLRDGRKAFSIIKKNDPEGAKNLHRYYPALYFAENYGIRRNLGKFAKGWYIPSSYETGCFSCPSSSYDFDFEKFNERRMKVSAAWEIINHEKFHFDIWGADAQILKNTLEIYNYYLTEHVPHDAIFSKNHLINLSYGDDGTDHCMNNRPQRVIVMRVFK